MRLTRFELDVLFHSLRDTLKFHERKDGGSFTYDRKCREEVLMKIAKQLDDEVLEFEDK